MHPHAHDLGVSHCQLVLEEGDLLLQGRDGAHAAVDGVPHSGVRFVHHGAHGVTSLVHRQVLELKESNNTEPAPISDSVK